MRFNLFVLSVNNYFLLTGILSNWTGIFNKKPTGTGILAKSLVGNGIATPLQDPPRTMARRSLGFRNHV